MKKFLIALNIVIWSVVGYQASAYAEDAKPETKKVCIKTTDPKTKKEVEKCKVSKIHQKHEGTTVPDGKKK